MIWGNLVSFFGCVCERERERERERGRVVDQSLDSLPPFGSSEQGMKNTLNRCLIS